MPGATGFLTPKKHRPAETGRRRLGARANELQDFRVSDRRNAATIRVSGGYMVDKFMSVAQAAKAWDISQARIRQWLADGRINGAVKIGRDWVIPTRAVRPEPAKPGALGHKAR